MKGKTIQENERYVVSLEISGSMAMWTDPGSGSTPTSYPVPTWSAVKGIFESILFLKSSQIFPIRTEILKPVQYVNYVQNYGGPLRKSDLLAKGKPFQFRMNVLRDVRYRCFAVPVGLPESYSQEKMTTTNGAHHYKDRFERRLRRGECFSTPFLGVKDFPASYWGPVESIDPPIDFNTVISSMVITPFNFSSAEKKFNPVFRQNVEVVHGVIVYPCDESVLSGSETSLPEVSAC